MKRGAGMRIPVYVGTYSRDVLFGDGSVFRGRGKGIYRFLLDPETGELSLQETADTANPSFVAVNRDETMLYAVNELEELEGEPGGGVTAFRLTEGKLCPVNTRKTRGLDPCHAALTPDEKHLCAANYGTGSLSVYQIEADGSLGELVQYIEHSGHGADPLRQAGPHCHSTAFSPDGRFAFVAELGTDRLLCYRLTEGTKPLEPGPCPVLDFDPGDGPRISKFSPGGQYLYAACELSNTVQVFRYSPEDGGLSRVQIVSTLPPDSDGSGCSFADIHFSGDGRFLYGSNRGHDSIVIFRVSPEDGTLAPLGWQPCGGRSPRSFAIDPTGSFLLCANQDSDNIALFRIDRETGLLRQAGSVPVGSPSCVLCCSGGN